MKNQIIVCFDIESRFDSPHTVGNGIARKHISMCLCARVVCNHCQSFETNDKTPDGFDFCTVYKRGTLQDEGVICVKEFGDYLYNCLAMTAEENDSKLLVLAHNFKGTIGILLCKMCSTAILRKTCL